MKEDISQTTCKLLTRKGFSEKPLVAFTNRTVFLLDLYILLSLFGLMFWLRYSEESSYTQLSASGSLSPDYKCLHARQISLNLSFHSQTIPDCIIYFIYWCLLL